MGQVLLSEGAFVCFLCQICGNALFATIRNVFFFPLETDVKMVPRTRRQCQKKSKLKRCSGFVLLSAAYVFRLFFAFSE